MEGAAVAPTVVEGWLVCKVPGKPLSIRLSQDVIARLAMAVEEGFRALPRRGLETGGLLLGTNREVGDQAVVDIEDFESIESEHAAGPSYLLSDADRCLLEARIAARKGAARSAPVVGFYRSHTRRDFAATPEDASVLAAYFRKTSDVFLLIKSNGDGPATGGFVIREAGKGLCQSPCVQFQLDPAAAVAASPEAPLPASPPPQMRPMAAPAGPPAALPRTAWNLRWPIWLATAGAVALAVGLPFEVQRRIPDSIPAKPALSLALDVANTGSSLRLSWDHHALRHAGHAILWIEDGTGDQRFELDSKQLNEGTVLYWPRTTDVNFRLELLSPDGNVTESVRAIGRPSPALVVAPTAAQGAVKPQPLGTSKAPAVDALETSPAPSPKPSPNDLNPTASPRQSRTFALPRAQLEPAPGTPAALPDPPTIQPVLARTIGPSEEFLKPIVPVLSQEPRDGRDSNLRVSVEPLSGSRLEHVVRNVPLIGKRSRRSDYVPPAPLHNPAVAGPPPGSVAREVDINVKVYVNLSGKVEYAEILSRVAKADRDLAALAMFSARRWEFVPARSGNVAVPGEVVLHYRFGPATRVAGNWALVAHRP